MKLKTIIQMSFSAIAKPVQKIQLPTLPDGKIIDIGGGGDGIIARDGLERVFPVDKFLSEIQEARDNAKAARWINAEAAMLPFPPQTFDLATAFFSLMYIPIADREAIFLEANRALKPGGEFWIWDAIMSSKSGVYALRLKTTLQSAQVVQSTYGVKAKDQTLDTLCMLLEKSGFSVINGEKQHHTLFIKARKPL